MEEKRMWRTAEVVFGRLISVSKDDLSITLEIKETDPIDEKWIWVPHSYDLPEDLSDEEYEKLVNHLDSEIKEKLIDREFAAEILPN